jgi:hypothetical protein
LDAVNRLSALRKVVEMETKPKREPSGSTVAGVIPGPIRVHHDSVPAGHDRAVESLSQSQEP